MTNSALVEALRTQIPQDPSRPWPEPAAILGLAQALRHDPFLLLQAIKTNRERLEKRKL